jgi:phosphoribosylformimino-5-aminoimidazole carboxamide ribotide isomerase
MPQIIPAVDILEGRVVRLLHGDYQKVTVYAEDPVECALGWIEGGASLVHVVDLAGARDGVPDPRLWEAMAAAGVAFQVGGGIRDSNTARLALEAGAQRVVMGTAAVWNPETLVEVGAPERVVAAVDVRSGLAQGSGWLDEGRPVEEVLEILAGLGVGRALVTGIGRDGTMEGPEVDLLGQVVGDGRFGVIASGGVGSLADLAVVARLGCEAVIVGRALYEHRFTLAEAIAL